MDKRLITIILTISNIIAILELPLYYPFISFILFSSSLSMIYEAQLSLIFTTLIALLISFFIKLISLQKIIIVSILMLISLIAGKNKWVYSLLLSLSPALIFGDSYYLLLILVLLIPLLSKIGEIRAIILSGIIYLITSGILFTLYQQFFVQLSTASYYYLLLGVIGVIIENKRINPIITKKFLIYFSFIPASLAAIMLGIPKNSQFLYWSINSFYFTHLYLPWILGLGYNINQHLLSEWIFAYLLILLLKNTLIASQVFLGIFTFLAGFVSYYVFKKLDLRYPLLLALLYQFNIFDPIINYSISIFSYAFLPLVILFAYNNKRILYSILTFVTATSLPIFLSSIIVPFIYRKYILPVYALGVNAFWLIPYLFFGITHLSLHQIPELYVLLAMLFISFISLLYYLEFKRNDVIYIIFISFILLLLGINVSPLILIYSLLLVGSIKNMDIILKSVIIALVLLSTLSFSYGLIIRYNDIAYYNYYSDIPKPGLYGFGINTNVNYLNLSVGGIPFSSINYSTKYFIINNVIMKNELYYGFPVPAIPNYTPQLKLLYAYTNSGAINFIYSKFNQLIGIIWYTNGPSKLTMVFPYEVESVSGINATINNNTITIFSDKPLVIIGGNITVNGKPIFSSYYKPKITTTIGVGEISEKIKANTSIYLIITQPVSINGKEYNKSIVLPPGEYTIIISDLRLEYISYISIMLTLISLILLFRRFRL